MNSYRCSQCGLANWVTSEFCKRCKSPNPQYVFTQQTAEYANQAQHGDYANGQNYAPQNYNAYQPSPDFSAPPPPNAFGSDTGTANYTGNYGQYQQTNYQRPPFRGQNSNYLSDSEQDELRTAEKQIRNAWISGVVVCSFTVIVAFIFSAISSKELAMIASPLEIMISAVVFGGLTIGVYCKSRACAVILCGLFILDKIITFAATGRYSGGLLAFVFIYYFAYGIQGTFTYYKLTKGRS